MLSWVVSDVGTVVDEEGIGPYKTCHGSHYERHATGYLCNVTHDVVDAERERVIGSKGSYPELCLGLVGEHAYRHVIVDHAV